MLVPFSGRKKALLVVDVQPVFAAGAGKALRCIGGLLSKAPYDMYVEALFHAERGSLWDRQQGWICPKGGNFRTCKNVSALLKGRNTIRVVKTARSVFKGKKGLYGLLRKRGIREVHIIGFETNDCVLATAFESFDLGFHTYVLEECCGSGNSVALHKSALKLLRAQNMTNNSCGEKIRFTKI